MGVREFVPPDVPQVVRLYWKHLGSRKGQPSAELPKSFAGLYFSSPWSDPNYPSFVYEDKQGEIVGFLGMITRKMLFRGECIRVRFGGNFVVDPKARSGFAAARLLEAMLAGPEGMIFTDSANDISKRLLEKVGFQLIPPLSIHWSRPLQPATYAVLALSRVMKSSFGAAAEMAGKPIAELVDKFVGSKLTSPPAPNPAISVEALDPRTLLDCIHETTKGQELQPVYEEPSLEWLLGFMEANPKRGKLRKILFRDVKRGILGWSLYFVRPGFFGEVVQVGATAGNISEVLTALLHDARQQGLVALHGVADYQSLAAFSDAGCFFTCRGGWALAHSNRADLIDSLLRGNSTLSRLDGEWALHPGE